MHSKFPTLELAFLSTFNKFPVSVVFTKKPLLKAQRNVEFVGFGGIFAKNNFFCSNYIFYLIVFVVSFKTKSIIDLTIYA